MDRTSRVAGLSPVAGPREPQSVAQFRLVVADVFAIAGRGVVVTGKVESGAVRPGSRVVVERLGNGSWP